MVNLINDSTNDLRNIKATEKLVIDGYKINVSKLSTEAVRMIIAGCNSYGLDARLEVKGENVFLTA